MASQQHHEQDRLESRETCWCKGASNLEEVKRVWMQEFMAQLKPSIGEEVENALNRVLLPYLPLLQKPVLPPNSSSLPHQGESSASGSLQLCFKGELPESLLTNTNIEDEGASLAVELHNDSGKKVEDGLESSLEVNFVVLDGDIDAKDLTAEKFNSYVAMPREYKGSLLKGNCKVSLSGGYASICGISFTDNSSKVVRNGKFKLGAHVTKNPSSGRFIRPAVSKAFKVKECRLKADLKHPTPSLEDDLWRLVNINKTGIVYRRAQDKGVRKVKDFLQRYHTDEKEMQDILGVSGKKWNEIVKNAEACSLTNEHYYQYYDDASGDYLILDCAFNIKSVTFKGCQTCQLYESLDFTQKKKVGKLRQAAYEKRNVLDIVDAATNHIPFQAGPAYTSSVQEQQQPVAPPPSMCPNAGELSVGTHQMHCYPTTNMQNPFTTAAYPDQSWQMMNLTTSACLSTEVYGGHNTSLVTQQAVNYGPDSQRLLPNETLGPAFFKKHFNDAPEENQGMNHGETDKNRIVDQVYFLDFCTWVSDADIALTPIIKLIFN